VEPPERVLQAVRRLRGEAHGQRQRVCGQGEGRAGRAKRSGDPEQHSMAGSVTRFLTGGGRST
jgi:hypothetical protein